MILFEDKKNQCIEDCEFMRCGYKCNSINGNMFYNEKTGIYEKIKTENNLYINFDHIQYELRDVRNIIK